MTMGWKYAKPVKEKLLNLEEPGKPLPFDADRRLVEEITSKFDIATVAKSLQGKDEKEAQKALEELGKEVMKLTMELADNKYMDRTGQMVETVAKQTGISFPHRLGRYVELSLLGLRPTDRWNIAKATTKELMLQVSSCSIQKALAEAGVKGLPCKGFCLASFEIAAEKTGNRIKTEMEKTLPQDGMCEFHISV
jgi:histone H3/H4